MSKEIYPWSSTFNCFNLYKTEISVLVTNFSWRTSKRASAKLSARSFSFAVAAWMQSGCSWPNATAHVRRAIYSPSHYSRWNLTRAALSGSLQIEIAMRILPEIKIVIVENELSREGNKCLQKFTEFFHVNKLFFSIYNICMIINMQDSKRLISCPSFKKKNLRILYHF